MNTQEESGVVLVAVSHFNIVEKIIRFIIYFTLNSLFAGSKRVKFPVVLTSRRVLRVLQTQDAECQLRHCQRLRRDPDHRWHHFHRLHPEAL